MKQTRNKKSSEKVSENPKYDVQQKEDKALKEYEDARQRIRANLFAHWSEF